MQSRFSEVLLQKAIAYRGGAKGGGGAISPYHLTNLSHFLHGLSAQSSVMLVDDNDTPTPQW